MNLARQIQDFYQHYALILLPAVLIVFYFYVTKPLLDDNQAINTQIGQQTELLSWMKASAKSVAPGTPTSSAQLTTADMLSSIETLAKKHKISNQLKDMRPLNNTSVKLWLKSVAFKPFILFLGELNQQHHVGYDSLRIRRSEQPGIVDVEIVLTSP